MLKPEDPLTDLKTLAADLRRTKPEGWSVVLGLKEIVVRPKDRTTGRFSIDFVRDGVCSAAFFSRELNYWNKRKHFNSDVSLAASLNEWMSSAAADPLKHEKND